MGGKEMTILHTGEVGNVGHAWTTFWFIDSNQYFSFDRDILITAFQSMLYEGKQTLLNNVSVTWIK